MPNAGLAARHASVLGTLPRIAVLSLASSANERTTVQTNALRNLRDVAYASATIIQRKTAILRINVKTTIGPSRASLDRNDSEEGEDKGLFHGL